MSINTLTINVTLRREWCSWRRGRDSEDLTDGFLIFVDRFERRNNGKPESSDRRAVVLARDGRLGRRGARARSTVGSKAVK